MKLVFVSNYFNHHQSFLADALFKATNGSFAFIETYPIKEERKNLGWGLSAYPEYVKCIYKSEEEYKLCEDLICSADIVITALPYLKIMSKRYKQKKLTFHYSERLFKTGFKPHLFIGRFLKYQKCAGKRKNMYLLATSGYAAYDYNKIGLYNGRAYRWAYFTEAKTYESDGLFNLKNQDGHLNILWAGRFIDWKHPELAVETAGYLKNLNIDFRLTMIGVGNKLQEIKDLALKNGLDKHIVFLGSMKPEEVRKHMEKSDIFLFTSDKNEGWGAVLNEAMNSGCAVIADKNIGAVPFLIKNGQNGLVYNNKNELFGFAEDLAKNKEKTKELGQNAYYAINKEWNPALAAERFLKLADEIAAKKESNLYKSGPCSKIQ